jgi:hypothetical protein
LEDLLKKFDNSKICKGYKINSYLKSQNSYIDPVGNLRHVMCKFILEEKDICQYCTCAIRSLNRKILRLSKNTKTTSERINTTLSRRKQSQIKRLQMKYKLVRQKKI